MALKRLFWTAILVCSSSWVFAEPMATLTAANQALIGDDGLGVELRFDPNGQLLSIKSTQLHPVEFPDRRGISKAYIIAEEKAKANIARYMQQVSTSSRQVREIDDSLSRATRSANAQGQSWSKENTRKVIESLEEVTGSSAQAVLRGVRILERSYDEKNEEVKVVVGINRQSIAGAAQLGSGLGSTNAPATSGANATPFPSQPSEQRRARDADSF